jgi:Thioredoxin
MPFPVSEIAVRFASGRTYPQYLAHMQKNRATLAAITRDIHLSADDVRFFSCLTGPIRALVISEDWCPDCALNVPVLMQIAGANPSLEVRFIGRDDNLDVLEHAKKGGRKAIPTILFFDADWNEIGHWIERPANVDARLAEWDAAHPAPSEPDRTHEVWRQYRQDRSNFRDEQFFKRGAWRDTVAELRRILSREIFSNVLELEARA